MRVGLIGLLIFRFPPCDSQDTLMESQLVLFGQISHESLESEQDL